jgi:RNA polymerase sigma-70 factor (family 1)
MPVNSLLNENQLLAQIAQGDQRAFQVIYDHYHQNVYTFALWYLKSAPDAEEVVQEVFLKLWLNAHSIGQLNSLQKYLRTIAGNRALDILRQKARRLKLVPISQDENTHPSHNETEESILLNDYRQILQLGIQQLPQQQKLVYQLCSEQGYKNDEVAIRLNLSPSTVRTHKKLALRFLREYLIKHTDRAAILSVMVLLKLI